MVSTSNLTTLCVVAACLLQNVAASTLQNPCILQQIEATLLQDSTLQDVSIFVCELQGQDSKLVEGGVSGSELTIEIKPEDVEVLLAQMENTKLDGVTIYAPGLAIDADNKLSFPEGVEIEFGMESSSAETNGDGRRLGVRDGIHSVLVVRVVASNTDTSLQYPAEVLSDKAFGTDGDTINLRERYRSCSYGQLLVEPTNNTLATNGVREITVNTEIIYAETKSEDVVNAAKMQLGDLVGGEDVTIKETFRHVIMCLPTGTTLKGSKDWVAYTYTGGCYNTNCGWLAVVNEDYCTSSTILSHEVAHNFGFQHSGFRITGNKFDQYRDQSGLMGASTAGDDTNICFNAPKSYQSGWYSSRDVTLDSSSTELSVLDTFVSPWTADLVGVADYENVSGEEVITVKLEDATTPYYIGFNRKTGIHADTWGPTVDKVTVSTQDEDGQSWLVVALDAGEFYDITDYFGPGKAARIEVLGYSTDATVQVARIGISRFELVASTFCEDDVSLLGTIGSVDYESLPITIISQDTHSVTIEVSNTWGEDVISNMFVRYDETNLESTCHETTQVTKTSTSRYTIACMSANSMALVDLFVADDSFNEFDNNAEVPECCHPEATDVLVPPTAQYVFEIQCASQDCPAEGIQRKLLRGSSPIRKGN